MKGIMRICIFNDSCFFVNARGCALILEMKDGAYEPISECDILK